MNSGSLSPQNHFGARLTIHNTTAHLSGPEDAGTRTTLYRLQHRITGGWFCSCHDETAYYPAFATFAAKKFSRSVATYTTAEAAFTAIPSGKALVYDIVAN
jgi:hypothetical protein